MINIVRKRPPELILEAGFRASFRLSIYAVSLLRLLLLGSFDSPRSRRSTCEVNADLGLQVLPFAHRHGPVLHSARQVAIQHARE
jgi:hypothetical protein